MIRNKLFTCTSALANHEIHLLGVAKLKSALNLSGIKVHYGIFSAFSNFKSFYVILELYFLSFDESRYEVYWRYIKAFRPKNVNHSNFIIFVMLTFSLEQTTHHPLFPLHRSNPCQPSTIPTNCLFSLTIP